MVINVTKTPQAFQARSRKTRQLILTAAVEVLTEGGMDSFSMLAVSDRAGVSVGSIYRRFGGKDQLLLAAQHEFITRFQNQFASQLTAFDDSDPDPSHRVKHAVVSLTSTFRDNGRSLRVLMLLALQNQAIYDEGSAASADGGQQFARFLAPIEPAMPHEQHDRAFDLAYRMIYASCAHRLTLGEWHESQVPLDWDGLSAGLASATAAYLLRGE